MPREKHISQSVDDRTRNKTHLVCYGGMRHGPDQTGICGKQIHVHRQLDSRLGPARTGTNCTPLADPPCALLHLATGQQRAAEFLARLPGYCWSDTGAPDAVQIRAVLMRPHFTMCWWLPFTFVWIGSSMNGPPWLTVPTLTLGGGESLNPCGRASGKERSV